MSTMQPRIPSSCPLGFKSHYTVVPGDRMYTISQKFKVSLDLLIKANPHISNPNLIIPGDVLCVPSILIALPCCKILTPQQSLPAGSGAGVFAQPGSAGTQSVSVIATLPAPSTFGNYAGYIVFVELPDLHWVSSKLMTPTNDVPPAWATRVDLTSMDSLTTDSSIVLSAVISTASPPLGDLILFRGSFASC